MAITTNAICNSFKKELLEGTHNFKASGGNSFKLSLYTSDATLGKSTTSFTSDNQVYYADLSFTGVTLTARGALIYNDTQGDKAVCVLNFGGDKTATNGTFTVQFPAFSSSAAIIRIA